MKNINIKNVENVSLFDLGIELNQVVANCSKSEVYQDINKLVDGIECEFSQIKTIKNKLDFLLKQFYIEWGFQGDYEEFYSSKNALLVNVLNRRKGIPVTLGVIFLYIGNLLGLNLKPICFPTQFILSIKLDDKSTLYLNPFDGQYLDKKTLQSWITGLKNPFMKLNQTHLEEAKNSDVLMKWIAVLKSTFLREERYLDALKFINIALTLEPEDAFEVRDRGYIYQQLDCNSMAINDYNFFIEKYPEDPASELLKVQIKALNDNKVVIH